MTAPDLFTAHASLPAQVLRRSNLAHRLPPALGVDDLLQVGRVALWRAAERFDAARGAKASTFAWPAVHGAMRDEIRAMRFGGRYGRGMCGGFSPWVDRTDGDDVPTPAWRFQASSEPTVPSHEHGVDALDEIRDLARRLVLRQRRVWWCWVAGMSPAETAKACRIPVTAVYDARKAIRHKLGAPMRCDRPVARRRPA